MRTQVCIIGGGPSGLLLGQLLHLSGIDNLVLERHPRDRVLSRIRAGVLEQGSVETLARAGLAERLEAEGVRQHGLRFSVRRHPFRLDLEALAGRGVMLYGQTEITRDLYEQRDAAGAPVVHQALGVALHDLDGDAPFVTYVRDGAEVRVDCDFVAGCDGFRGVSRASIPPDRLKSFEHVFPFAWLGVLAQTPPVAEEQIYANHPRGFALCSMRHARLSRYYLQVPADEGIEGWTDAAFWDELRRRLPEESAEALVTGAAIEKSVVPLRAHVTEPMQWGRLFLVGDAAHIAPPTGAKGLNLAISDVHYLHQALTAHYAGETGAAERYSHRALARVWQALRFSCRMTAMLHNRPGEGEFEQRLREAGLAHLEASAAAQTELAENYTGLPY